MVSGYRHPDVAKNPHSPHMKGLACDFRVEGVKTTELRDYLRRTFDKVGVGYYPNSSLRAPRRAQGPVGVLDRLLGAGRAGGLLGDPDQDLKNGRADSYHPTKIDKSWVQDPRTRKVRPKARRWTDELLLLPTRRKSKKRRD